MLGVLFGLFDQAFDGHGVDDHLAVAVRLEGHAGGALGENGAGETRVGGAVFADSEFAFDGAEEDEDVGGGGAGAGAEEDGGVAVALEVAVLGSFGDEGVLIAFGNDLTDFGEAAGAGGFEEV